MATRQPSPYVPLISLTAVVGLLVYMACTWWQTPETAGQIAPSWPEGHPWMSAIGASIVALIVGLLLIISTRSRS